jgi:hypothetical protein
MAVARELRQLASEPLEGIKVQFNEEDVTDVVADIAGPGALHRLSVPWLRRGCGTSENAGAGARSPVDWPCRDCRARKPALSDCPPVRPPGRCHAVPGRIFQGEARLAERLPNSSTERCVRASGTSRRARLAGQEFMRA